MRAAIVLAAGQSRRFGATNKLVMPFLGKPLLRHAIDTALRAPVGRVIVVTGAGRTASERLSHAVRSQRVETVRAKEHRKGHHVSLLAGLSRLRRTEREVFVFLGDMPLIPRQIAHKLALSRGTRGIAVRAAHRGKPGHPVLIRDIQAVRRRLEARLPPLGRSDVQYVQAGQNAVSDIDKRGDVQRLSSLAAQ